jgi:hypothetical protein
LDNFIFVTSTTPTLSFFLNPVNLVTYRQQNASQFFAPKIDTPQPKSC